MRFAKILGKALTILVVGPLTGAVLGFIASVLLMRPDPTGGRAPGDGIVVIFCVGIGVLFSAFASVIAAAVLLVTHWPTKSQPSS